MSRRSLTHAAPFALVLSLAGSLAHAQAAPPAAAPAQTAPAAPSNSTSAPTATPPRALGPDMSKVTENLDTKLEAMQGTANGLTADEVARRTLIKNPDVTAKQKSVEAADANRDQT